ncbi:hypothetical protein [Chryseobacterium salivictor]|uniref:Uncharacterized protein n=1 Tax=Chryseobacterium salivictor TaxID=2547600 RepID=A0A4P6ZI66_9FLAO|nr:hypothetical protein [Chryseobacterium salivictor]QBO59520.1 hypothetical protein NBC122_02719 [Chryseobacterium salivictor]
MKRTIFSTVAIAATFVVFSFAPAEKNNTINKTEVTTLKIPEGGACDARFQTNQTFSKCDTRWTETSTAGKSQDTALKAL